MAAISKKHSWQNGFRHGRRFSCCMVDIGSAGLSSGRSKTPLLYRRAILFISTEYADLANLCDRVLVMRNGRQVGELSGDAMSEQRIIAQCIMSDVP